MLGLDLGLKHFCVISNSEYVDNNRYLRKSEAKLVKAQRKLSKCKLGSNNRFKQQKKVFKIHERINNQRLYFLHNLSSKLINENQVICLEDLNVHSMVQNKRLAKHISDVCWSKFIGMLEYKSAWYGRTLIKIDLAYTSKTCSRCGSIKDNLTLNDRTYNYSLCGLTLNRDYNASLNILRKGVACLKTQNRRFYGDSLLNIPALAGSSQENKHALA